MDSVSELLLRAGLPASGARERLAGGDVSEVWRAGGAVVKVPPAGERAGAGMFPAEAAGLAALRGAGIRVPEVRWSGEEGLVMEDLGAGPEDWEGLGRMVARLHAGRGSRGYGAAPPLYIATIALPGGWSPDWGALYRERRIEPLLAGLDPGRAERIRGWLGGVALPCEGPCLVHGDLWRGNALFGRDGPALVDPSAQWAERGLDLAMIRLFGGFPPAFHQAYADVLPIPAEVERTLPAYTLYFLLVHVRLFGAGYLPALDRLVAR